MNIRDDVKADYELTRWKVAARKYKRRYDLLLKVFVVWIVCFVLCNLSVFVYMGR